MDRRAQRIRKRGGKAEGARRARFAHLALAAALGLAGAARAQAPAAPERLADTGLYADFATRAIDPANLPFSPQYPLWTDGAAKRRWVRIPAGAAIDASDADRWLFPVGTRFWKEFSFGGRPVETRYLELGADGEWLYATYAWSEDGSDARLAPASGVRGVVEIAPGVRHDLPGVYDCRSCHEGQPTRVIGFSALQLSPDRDPLAPHAQTPEPGSVDLASLVARGLLRGLPVELLRTPPRVEAPTPTGRAALGYLHANCGHCHNPSGPLADLDFSLQVSVLPAHQRSGTAATSAVDRVARFRPAASAPVERIAAGDPGASLLVRRMAARDGLLQMPPLGTHRVDDDALALVAAWIRNDLRRPAHERAADIP